MVKHDIEKKQKTMRQFWGFKNPKEWKTSFQVLKNLKNHNYLNQDKKKKKIFEDLTWFFKCTELLYQDMLKSDE